jgi:ATP-dependent DNA helicase RecG
MSLILPIDVSALLHFRGIESARVEFKASWDSSTNSGTAAQVLRTISAFANDYQNLNGGYLVIGVAEADGKAQLPPKGLTPEEIAEAQSWIRGNCNRISPAYQPLLSPEVVDGRNILVIWAPGGDNRPYECPESLEKNAPRHHYIRQGADTVKAQGEMLRSLLQLTAKVPFDDRRSLEVPLEQVSMNLVRRHLQDIGSGLAREQDDREVLRRMRLSVPVNGHEAPRNIALLMFTSAPETWFPGARIEVVQFAGDSGGNVIQERPFTGPFVEQLRECLHYLHNLSTAHFQKRPDRAETQGWTSYPLPALEETLVNAVYHRSYEGEPEPVKVYLYPDRLEIISYPGPVPGIELQHFEPGARVPPVPARNRRIGEFLKELRLAESRGTGIPKVRDSMARNGSPTPRFDFDPARTFFRVTLPAHPEYLAISTLRDVAQLEAVGDREGAFKRLADAHSIQPDSSTLTAKFIELLAKRGELARARTVYEAHGKAGSGSVAPRVSVALANALMDAREFAAARQILDGLSTITHGEDAIEAAILEKRARRDDRAHALFQKAGEAVFSDARALHEFAQVKMKLSHPARFRDARVRGRSEVGQAARVLLLREAKDMLQRVLQLPAGDQRHAWAWLDLGRVSKWLGEPAENARQAFAKARELAPHDPALLRMIRENQGGAA